jgi:hypothetical protein
MNQLLSLSLPTSQMLGFLSCFKWMKKTPKSESPIKRLILLGWNRTEWVLIVDPLIQSRGQNSGQGMRIQEKCRPRHTHLGILSKDIDKCCSRMIFVSHRSFFAINFLSLASIYWMKHPHILSFNIYCTTLSLFFPYKDLTISDTFNRVQVARCMVDFNIKQAHVCTGSWDDYRGT